MNHQKSVLFLTTSNLSTNPRLVKEVDLALQLGYRVSVISFSFNNWSNPLNDAIKKKFGASIRLIEIPADKKPFFPWFLSSIFQQLNRNLILFSKKNVAYLSYALHKRTWLLVRAMKKLQGNFDLIAAHNPGSFYPAYRYATQKKIPFGIDVEDYHPGEFKDANASALMRKMMQAILPAAAYVTAASPLIMEKVNEDCNGKLVRAASVLNYFDSADFLTPVTPLSSKLQLVWFSQYIDAGRGLEELIEAVQFFTEKVELHLYGQLNADFYNRFIHSATSVIIHPPISQTKLHEQLLQYDVGLALENSTANYNREICITNKLLSYFQAGLYILASDTNAQQQFLEQHPDHGAITKLTIENLKAAIRSLVNQKEKIRQTAISRHKTAQPFNSTNELEQLAVIWKQVLQ